jgi:hypothetical protein
MKAQESLIDDVRHFQDGLRWRKYDLAADYVPARARERFLDAREEVDEDLRIDDYEVERIMLEDGRDRAEVRIRYTWHLESVGTVHNAVVEEEWEKQGKVWRIVAAEQRRARAGEAAMPSVLPRDKSRSALP